MRTDTKEGTRSGGEQKQGWVPRLSIAVRATSVRGLGTKVL